MPDICILLEKRRRGRMCKRQGRQGWLTPRVKREGRAFDGGRDKEAKTILLEDGAGVDL